MKGPLFYAKILLFGEYGIIKDSKGLAIPYNSFQGALKTEEHLSEAARQSNINLAKEFLHKEQLFDESFSSYPLTSQPEVAQQKISEKLEIVQRNLLRPWVIIRSPAYLEYYVRTFKIWFSKKLKQRMPFCWIKATLEKIERKKSLI